MDWMMNSTAPVSAIVKKLEKATTKNKSKDKKPDDDKKEKDKASNTGAYSKKAITGSISNRIMPKKMAKTRVDKMDL